MRERVERPPTSDIGLLRLLLAFLRLGAISFGGSTAAWLYRDIVLTRRWVDDQGFAAMLGIGQVFPGANAVKLTVLIGDCLHGAAGAALALAGLLTPPFLIVLAIGAVYAELGASPLVRAMLDGVAAAVIGLTFATGLRTLSHGAPGIVPLAFGIATVLSVGVLRWPILPVVAALAPLSVGYAFLQVRGR